MQKRGQVTVFIIVGIVLLLVVGLLFFQQGQDETETVLIDRELITVPYASSVQDFVQSCFEQVVELGVLQTGRQGGYWESPLDYSIIFFDDSLPYYYADEKMMIISEVDAEKELERYIEETLPTCLQNFSHFEEEGYKIMSGKVDVNVDFGQQVIVELKYPLEVQKGITVIELHDFVHTVDINIQKFLETARKIVQKHMDTEGYVCLTCIDEWATDDDVIITVFPVYDTGPFGNDLVWFTMQDKDTALIKGNNFTFEFIVEAIPVKEKEEFVMEDIVSFDILSNILFEYQIKTNKDDVLFYDDTDMFDINNDGLIKFTPSEDQKGSHFVEIEAQDNIGNIDTELILFTIN
ncbi:hypothetical protein COV17_03585 [Candidatus Woesearchaeota archaeon CG10_big_fil_rev_8_21_14_0_10_36_11]|nr:MAG: hypothetical protein COV17_03585 [Candidatus Woesearchaeota archaeon CG10_big_fil_rev_8_21_14_0_10_36_11]